jgi:hypothetical protein
VSKPAIEGCIFYRVSMLEARWPPLCGGYPVSLTAAGRRADLADLLTLELANL